MARWQHQLRAHEFEQTQGDSEKEDRKLGMRQSMGSQRVRQNLANEQQDTHHRLKDNACVLEIGKEFYK